MRYLGGKVRTARRIVDTMLDGRSSGGTYWEPFLGGAAVAAEVARRGHFRRMVLSDVHPDLVMLWREVIDGWTPPAELSPEEYERLRHAPPSAIRGWAGFAASYNGKWYGGYGPKASGRDYLAESVRSTARKAGALRAVVAEMRVGDFRSATPLPGDVVYLDPPYAGTTGYSTGTFDTEALWSVASVWFDMGVDVFVSEYTAPSGWSPIWTTERSATVDASTTKRATEALYRADRRPEVSP